MRYERGGKAKYWIPSPNEINENTSLLRAGESSRNHTSRNGNGTTTPDLTLEPDEEELYAKARKLEFGDWNVRKAKLDAWPICSYIGFANHL
jgi:hypothetical protein